MSLPPLPQNPTPSIYQSFNQNQKQSSDSYDLDYYRKYSGAPKPGPLRNEDVKETFPNSEKDLHKLLWEKHENFLKNGYSSLVGKVAVDIAQSIVRDKNTSKIFSNITFCNQYGNDIVVSGKPASYKDIIERMEKEGKANLDTAAQILTNLSKNYNHNSEKIFAGLDGSAKRLMAFLICETIRFQEDGACARMAMRMVINEYEDLKLDSNSSVPFEHVFVTGDNYDHLPTPYSIFAISPGGTSRMRGQFYSVQQKGNSNFANDESILIIRKNNISDDESAPHQSNNNFNTVNERRFGPLAPNATHSMHDKSRFIERGVFKDLSSGSSASSSTNPTPIRTTSYSLNQSGPQLSLEDQETTNFLQPLTNNGFGGTENDYDNCREEEAQHKYNENQARSGKHYEEELNDSMEVSQTINNDFGEANQGTAATQAFIRGGGFQMPTPPPLNDQQISDEEWDEIQKKAAKIMGSNNMTKEIQEGWRKATKTHNQPK